MCLAAVSQEMLCQQKEHVEIIDQGRPDDVMIGISNCHVSLVRDNMPCQEEGWIVGLASVVTEVICFEELLVDRS